MTPFADASGQAFLEAFAALNPNGFEGQFSSIASRLGLGTTLSGAEIGLLSEAAYLATLCRIAFNGLGGCKGQIKPEREQERIRLEQSFVAACSRLWASPGWQRLALTTKDAVGRALLRPSVEDQHVAA